MMAVLILAGVAIVVGVIIGDDDSKGPVVSGSQP